VIPGLVALSRQRRPGPPDVRGFRGRGLIRAVRACFGHTDPDLGQHGGGDGLGPLRQAAGGRGGSGGGGKREGACREECLDADPADRGGLARGSSGRPAESERVDGGGLADEFSLCGRRLGGGEDVDHPPVGRRHPVIRGGSEDLIDNRVLEGERLVVES